MQNQVYINESLFALIGVNQIPAACRRLKMLGVRYVREDNMIMTTSQCFQEAIDHANDGDVKDDDPLEFNE